MAARELRVELRVDDVWKEDFVCCNDAKCSDCVVPSGKDCVVSSGSDCLAGLRTDLPLERAA